MARERDGMTGRNAQGVLQVEWREGAKLNIAEGHRGVCRGLQSGKEVGFWNCKGLGKMRSVRSESWRPVTLVIGTMEQGSVPLEYYRDSLSRVTVMSHLRISDFADTAAQALHERFVINHGTHCARA